MVTVASSFLSTTFFTPFTYFGRSVANIFSPFGQGPVSDPKCHSQSLMLWLTIFAITTKIFDGTHMLKMKRSFLEDYLLIFIKEVICIIIIPNMNVCHVPNTVVNSYFPTFNSRKQTCVTTTLSHFWNSHKWIISDSFKLYVYKNVSQHGSNWVISI